MGWLRSTLIVQTWCSFISGSTQTFSLRSIVSKMDVSLSFDKRRLPGYISHSPFDQIRDEVCVRIDIHTVPHRSAILLSLIDEVEPSQAYQYDFRNVTDCGN